MGTRHNRSVQMIHEDAEAGRVELSWPEYSMFIRSYYGSDANCFPHGLTILVPTKHEDRSDNS